MDWHYKLKSFLSAAEVAVDQLAKEHPSWSNRRCFNKAFSFKQVAKKRPDHEFFGDCKREHGHCVAGSGGKAETKVDIDKAKTKVDIDKTPSDMKPEEVQKLPSGYLNELFSNFTMVQTSAAGKLVGDMGLTAGEQSITYLHGGPGVPAKEIPAEDEDVSIKTKDKAGNFLRGKKLLKKFTDDGWKHFGHIEHKAGGPTQYGGELDVMVKDNLIMVLSHGNPHRSEVSPSTVKFLTVNSEKKEKEKNVMQTKGGVGSGTRGHTTAKKPRPKVAGARGHERLDKGFSNFVTKEMGMVKHKHANKTCCGNCATGKPCCGKKSKKKKDAMSSIDTTSGGALVGNGKKPKKKPFVVTKKSLVAFWQSLKGYIAKSGHSFFSDCPRDDKGHCKSGSGGGSSESGSGGGSGNGGDSGTSRTRSFSEGDLRNHIMDALESGPMGAHKVRAEIARAYGRDHPLVGSNRDKITAALKKLVKEGKIKADVQTGGKGPYGEKDTQTFYSMADDGASGPYGAEGDNAMAHDVAARRAKKEFHIMGIREKGEPIEVTSGCIIPKDIKGFQVQDETEHVHDNRTYLTFWPAKQMYEYLEKAQKKVKLQPSFLDCPRGAKGNCESFEKDMDSSSSLTTGTGDMPSPLPPVVQAEMGKKKKVKSLGKSGTGDAIRAELAATKAKLAATEAKLAEARAAKPHMSINEVAAANKRCQEAKAAGRKCNEFTT